MFYKKRLILICSNTTQTLQWVVRTLDWRCLSWPNTKNAEGYADPTAFGAFCAIEKKKKKLSGHSGPSYISAVRMPEMSNATLLPPDACSRFAVDAGYIPIAPHLLFPQFLDDNKPKERELGLFFGNAILSKCAEMWVFGDRISEAWRPRSRERLEGTPNPLLQRDLRGGNKMRFTLYRSNCLEVPEKLYLPS